MSDLPELHIARGELVTDEDRISVLFERAGVEDMLRRFAFGEPVGETDVRQTSEEDLDQVLTTYAVELATLAFQEGSIDLQLVRTGFDRVSECMNEMGNAKYGGEPPRTWRQSLLEKIGLQPPIQKRYFALLDDRYWQIQFMQQHDEQTWLRRSPGQTDASYFAQYTAVAMHSFLLAPYSYI